MYVKCLCELETQDAPGGSPWRKPLEALCTQPPVPTDFMKPLTVSFVANYEAFVFGAVIL